MAVRLAGLLCLLAAPAGAQVVDTLAASAAAHTFEANCRAFGESLWGHSLCGPLVMVHAPTRAALASRPDPAGTFEPVAGVYAGRLPDGMLVANTAVPWAGDRWAMVLLPLPSDSRDRHSLLAHEAFHRLQPELGLPAADPANPHLDEEAGRVWLRVELRALARALEATGEDSRAAVRDALAFRAYRHHLYPGADTLEAALELHEGLAEYTGVRYAALVLGDEIGWTVRSVRGFETRPSYVRSFPYATGPAMGLLLDRFTPGWRERVGPMAMAELLADAIGPGTRAAPDPVEVTARAMAYGHRAVAAEEADRAARLAARLADIRRRLVEAPAVLLEQQNLMASFDPNAVVPVAGSGTYYPTGTFQADWGRVEVQEGGALVSPDWSSLRLPATEVRLDGRTARGAGWTLELAEGWSLRPRDGGWEAVRDASAAR